MTPPTTAPRKSRRKLWIGLGVLALLFVACGVSVAGNVPAVPVPSIAPTAPQQPAAAAPIPEVSTEPLTTFGNGTYDVGTDVAPGEYRSPGVQGSIAPMCYWELTSSEGAILKNNVASEGPSRATLEEGLRFRSQGCEDWVRS